MNQASYIDEMLERFQMTSDCRETISKMMYLESIRNFDQNKWPRRI